MKLALGCFISFFAFLILCVVLGALYPAMTPPEPLKAAPKNYIDYDWNTGKYIMPADTIELMRNPYGRGWIRKDTFKVIQKVKPIPVKGDKQTTVEDVEEEVSRLRNETDN